MNAEKILSYPESMRQAKIKEYALKVHDKGSAPFEALRLELLKVAQHYKPRHTKAQYVAAMERFAKDFHLQKRTPDVNEPYAYQLFTIESQRVYGNCPTECIDNAIDEADRRMLSRILPKLV